MQERLVMEITGESVAWIAGLQRLDGLAADPGPLSERCRGTLTGLRERARQAGLANSEVDDLFYPFVALADEVVMASEGELLREVWKQAPLQFAVFLENNAGEGFFVRLERLLADPHARAPIVRAYYLCLVLGFRGRHAIRGGEVELRRWVQRLTDFLEKKGLLVRDGSLAPQGLRPHEQLRAPRSLPWLALAAIGLTLSAAAAWAVLHARHGDEVAAAQLQIKAEAGRLGHGAAVPASRNRVRHERSP